MYRPHTRKRRLRRLCFYTCLSAHRGGYPSMPCKWYPSMPCRSPGPHLGGSPGHTRGGGGLLDVDGYCRAVRILLECILVLIINLTVLFSIFCGRIHQLEKDLFYYKKTSRDLKKKLRELLASNPTPTPHNDEGTNHGKIVSFIYKTFDCN